MTSDPFLTPAEVAQELRVSAESVKRAIKAGRLTAFRDGRLIRIRRSAVDAYIEQQTGSRPQPRRIRRAS